MNKTEYDIPIFNDEDIADLNEYSELMAESLKKQLNYFHEEETKRQKNEKARQNAETGRIEAEKERAADIEFLKEENTMLKNLLPTVSSSGEYITLTGTAEAKFKKFRVEGNSVQEGEPSIETPIEIRNCGDNVNLCPTTIDGWEQGYIDVTTGNIWNNSDAIATKDFIEVEPNKKYYIKLNNAQTYTLRTVNLYDENKQHIEYYKENGANVAWAKTEISITIPENIRYIKLALLNVVDGNTQPLTPEIVPSIQIKMELGSKASIYTPYNFGGISIKIKNNADQEKAITFPLKEGQVLHKDDYLAEDEVHQARKATIMDENLDIGFSTQDNDDIYSYYCHFADIYIDTGGGTTKEIKSNYFKQSAYKPSYNLGDMVKNNSGSNSIYFKTNFETVDLFKAWLKEKKESGNPIIIEYPLAEEIIEEYTEEQKTAYDQLMSLTSYKDTTHIFSEDEVSPVFDVTAYAKPTDTVQKQTVSEIQDEPYAEEPTFKAKFLRPSTEEGVE